MHQQPYGQQPGYPQRPPQFRTPWPVRHKFLAGLICAGIIAMAVGLGLSWKPPKTTPAANVAPVVTRSATPKPSATAKARAAAAVRSHPAPKAAKPVARMVTPEAACRAFAVWGENPPTVLRDAAVLRRTFAETTDRKLSRDFAAYAGAIDPSLVISDGDRFASDCSAFGVTVFPAAKPSPLPSVPAPSAPPADTVTYIVSGDYAQVTYGPAGSDDQGSVPMNVTQPLGDPIYYAINAQLQGGGTVSCEIEVDGQVISQASASGGYNIASCEISQDPITGDWQNTNDG